MADPRTHYQELLAQYYTWMFGVPFAQQVAEQQALLETILGAAPAGGAPRGPALDLGCGPGFQAIALANLGFRPVTALDSSAELLAELHWRAGALPIVACEADLLSIGSLVGAESTAVITCMGDTLTHLADQADVRSLFAQIAAALAPHGRVVISYRDLSVELTGLERFFNVRSDADTVMSCFVEYTDAAAVTVHDLIHVREGAHWQLRKSCYRKLRLPCDWVVAELARTGLSVDPPASSGRLTLLSAHKR